MAAIVSLHAHPDDEALLCGGWLAQRAAAGDRVVLAYATDGDAGLAADRVRADGLLGQQRRLEAQRAARALGVARVVWLGYADSGMAQRPTAGPNRLVAVPLATVAAQVARIVDEEGASVLTGYDARGGYGHPDHLRVHLIARAAQAIAQSRPRLLEATLDRTWLVRLCRLARPVQRVLPGITVPGDEIFSDRSEVTLRVDVRDQLAAKRAALAAHDSQTGGGLRTVGLLLGLPTVLARRVLGTEYFHEVA